MHRPSVVLDTNVIISAQLKPAGLERRIYELAMREKVELCVTDAILAEYADVLARSKFPFKAGMVKEALKNIRAFARVVVPLHSLQVSPDPSDNIFLECAEAANADFLITGNKRHFPAHWKGTRVLNAREFFDQFEPQ